jgi:hypothetical protein
MTVTILQFYFLVLATAIIPLITLRLGWIATSTANLGRVLYISHTTGRRTGRQTYPVVAYYADNRIIFAM